MGRQVAVLVNRHAQGVTERHLDELRRIVGERVYVTQTIAEGTAAVRKIVDAGIDAIAIAGGDGTFAQVAAPTRTPPRAGSPGCPTAPRARWRASRRAGPDP